ncbi:hypothetical protein MSAS_43040 [Mycobacterium saskatchewanense]|uniref:Peptidase M48 n=1 Tax=Mycobacterium saskatchewanense TaxID=220927 RepID=A0AAJ3NSA9_9MYCO|nr:M56 family metallopeptidase [Mycobacterium saskatchewanense]ORW73681.1 peptidase M48 [Mycobacterium saskatchewanense]BBX65130.1 hypothetical protein MSAS_43040 [Mycobacterium saskatchewanense]
MSVAACLFLYGVLASVAGAPLLRRLTRDGQMPRFGVTVWVAAICSVLIAWLTATALVVLDVARTWVQPAAALLPCISRLHAAVAEQAGVASHVTLAAVAAAATGVAAACGIRLLLTLIRLRARAHEHAESVRMVGRHNEFGGVVVVDAGEPAAYCVAGRPPAIVVTSGALSTLDETELGAVLAHERAHLAGRHTHLSAALRGLALVFPFLPLMTQGAAEVSRLLEMCADDAAVRQYGRRALLSGLITLAGATPAPALGAATVAVMARAERLMSPPSRRTGARAALTALAALAAGPLITVALTAACRVMCGG